MFRSKATVGLDIGSSLVKAVQLKRTSHAPALEKFGMAEIYPSGERSDNPAEVRQLKIDAVRRALQQADISAKNAITAVSGESVIVRYIQLPEMPEAELKNALRWEAEEYIPFRIEDVNLDSAILGRAEEAAGSGKVDVLLVSAKKELINSHLDIVREAGLNPLIVDVDSFAFLNCFEVNHEPQPRDVIALLNIGAQVTNINVYVGGVSRFSRDIAIAGDSITAAIQSRVGVGFREAEDIKHAAGAPSPDDKKPEAGKPESSLIDTIRGAVERVAGDSLGESTPEAIAVKAIRTTLSNLVSEIRRSIQFFENQSAGKPVERIVLGGGTSRMRSIQSFLEQELKLPVQLINPLQRIEPVGNAIDQTLLNSSRELLGVGIGLGLRGVMD